jgi:hypothetical protein
VKFEAKQRSFAIKKKVKYDSVDIDDITEGRKRSFGNLFIVSKTWRGFNCK